MLNYRENAEKQHFSFNDGFPVLHESLSGRGWNPSPMRAAYALFSPEKKNVLLILYLLGFALLNAALYVYPILAVILLFAYPAGALICGFVTGDAVRAFLAGMLSYMFFFLIILLSLAFANYSMDTAYLVRFTGYHLTLLFVLGMIGWMSAKEENLPRILALPLSVLWVLLFLSGIS